MNSLPTISTNILVDPSLDEAFDAIAADYPEFKDSTIEVINTSMDNSVFIVDNTYIFRFPKKDSEQFEKEFKVLLTLKGRTSSPIPNLQYIGKTCQYMRYKKLSGYPADAIHLKILPEDKKGIFSYDLSRFIYELHTAFSYQEISDFRLGKIALPTVDTSTLSDIISKTSIDNDAQQSLIDDVASLNPADAMDEKERVVHQDLNDTNVLIDTKEGHLAGILDFGNIGIGSIYLEFISIFRFDPLLGKMTVDNFNNQFSISISTDIVRQYSIIFEILKIGQTDDESQIKKIEQKLVELAKAI